MLYSIVCENYLQWLY